MLTTRTTPGEPLCRVYSVRDILKFSVRGHSVLCLCHFLSDMFCAVLNSAQALFRAILLCHFLSDTLRARLNSAQALFRAFPCAKLCTSNVPRYSSRELYFACDVADKYYLFSARHASQNDTSVQESLGKFNRGAQRIFLRVSCPFSVILRTRDLQHVCEDLNGLQGQFRFNARPFNLFCRDNPLCSFQQRFPR